MKRSAILAVGVAVALAATTTAAFAVDTADGQIKGGSASVFIGNNEYNDTGLNQTARARLSPGERVKFRLLVENDGGESGAEYRATGCASNRKFRVTYAAGGDNVTNEMTDGGFVTEPLDPLEESRLSMTIKAKAASSKGNKRECAVAFTSEMGGEGDTVAGKATVR